MINAIIIDDEPKAIELLNKMLEKFCPEVKVIETYKSLSDIVASSFKIKFDLVFLDINLGKNSGFDILKKVDFDDAAIVLVTAHDNFGIQAIKNRVFDYIVKPVDPNELIETVNKLMKDLTKKKNQTEQSSDSFILIPLNNSYVRLIVNDLYYIEADGMYSRIVLNDNTFLTSKPIKHFETILPNKKFFRVHNSFLVNLSKIKYIKMGRDQPIILINDQEVPVSRNKRKELMELL